jgi:tetratricopeptide (TPR) repeat protein
VPIRGRDRDLQVLRDAVARSPLVTIWGPIGVGKSRLVDEALEDRADRCSLEAASDREQVLRAVASALGARSLAPSQLEDFALRARARRRGRPLILDGADRAIGALETLLPRWLERQGGPIVITACRALGVPGERAIELEPLEPSAALALFEDETRARGHRADPRIAERIVEMLDRLPLAICWFATRVAIVGDRAALDHLGRHETIASLGSTLDATIEVLDDGAREALFLSSVFERGAGARTLELGLHRAGRDDALPSIDALVRASMVRAVRRPGRPPRITAYRVVLAHVRERAAREGRWQRDIERHADLALRGTDRPMVGDPGDGGAELADERAELEAVRDRLERSDPERALRACIALVPLDADQGSAQGAAIRLRALLEHAPEDPALLGRAHVALALLERRSGRPAAAREHLEIALGIEGAHRFEARLERAAIDRLQSRLDAALEGYEAALGTARALGDPRLESIALGELGRMLQSLGRSRDAIPLHADAIAIARTLGLRHREALERSLHARAMHRSGEVREAIPLHERALAMHLELANPHLAAAERGHLGFCFHELGERDRAEAELRLSIEGLAEVGDVTLEAIERLLLARLLVDRERLEEARLELAIVRRLLRDLDMPRIALTHAFVEGSIALASGRLEDACALWRDALRGGALFEVGFEALLPAYLGVAEAAVGTGDARARIAESEAALGACAEPGLVAALAVLRAAVERTPLPDVPASLLARSHEARRAIGLAASLAPRAVALTIARDGGGAVLPDGRAIDLHARKAPRRLLVALAAARLETPGVAVGRERLIEAGWPDERIRAEAAESRLRTAIWTLRRIGLEPFLLTRDDGYLLDPLVPLRWSERAPEI